MGESLKLAVLGAGNIGYAMAGDMSLMGHHVYLYEVPKFAKENLEPIREHGGIDTQPLRPSIKLPRTGLAMPDKLTSDIDEAVRGVDVVFITVPSNFHARFFNLLVHHLEDGQIVVIQTGNWGSFELEDIMWKNGILPDRNIKIAETNIAPYACRRFAYSKDRTKPWLVMHSAPGYHASGSEYLAAIPATGTDDVLTVVRKMYPKLRRAESVIETSSMNFNLIHIPVMVCNAGILESRKGDFYFWKEGVSPKVGEVLDAVDQERVEVLKAIGVDAKSLLSYYWSKAKNWYDGLHTFYHATHTSHATKIWVEGYGNQPFRYRYLAEDTPCQMIPLVSLGNLLGVHTPTMSGLVQLASILSEIDFWKIGRTVDKMGFTGFTGKEILKRAMHGREKE